MNILKAQIGFFIGTGIASTYMPPRAIIEIYVILNLGYFYRFLQTKYLKK